MADLGTSRKRAAAEDAEEWPINERRTALSELPNFSNAVVSVNPSWRFNSRKPKCKSKTKVMKALVPATAAKTKDVAEEAGMSMVSDDPKMCVAYAADIYDHFQKMEAEPKRRPLPNYMEKIQSDLSANMRGILVDWLVEVTEEYRLEVDTLYLTISYIDRFLSLNPLNRKKLQLLGVSSMLVAAKYEETSPPDVEDFCYITEYTYPRKEVVKMEAEVLKSLNFELGNPTIKTFLRRFTGVAQMDCRNYPVIQLEFLGSYLGELSLLDYNCVRFLPSLVAASVVFLARFILSPTEHPWSFKLQKCSGYKPSDLLCCVVLIHDLYLRRRGGNLQAVREKYKQVRFNGVALLPSSPEIPVSYFDDIEE